MNKKIFIAGIAIIFVLSIFIILLAFQNHTITPEEAEELCYSVFGEKDEDTGFLFSFGVTGTVEKDKKQYYTIRASWLVNNSHMSYIGDFFVRTDGKEIYDGFVQGDEYKIEKLIWRE